MDQVIKISGPMDNCYLVKGGHIYLVDTGAPTDRKKLYRALQEQGVRAEDLSHILITHYHVDHTGNLADLQGKCQAKVVAGVEDTPYIEGKKPAELPSELNRLGRTLRKMPRLVQSYQKCKPASVEVVVNGGGILEELGLEVVALPGHTRGGMAYVDRANNRAFTGDLVSNYFGHPGLPIIMSSYSLEDIEASLRRLAELELDYMYPGHGRIIGPHASRLVDDLVKRKF